MNGISFVDTCRYNLSRDACLTKTEKTKSTLAQTEQRRQGQIPVVYELKVNLNCLSKKNREHLFKLFVEAKWFYNHIVADIENRLVYETYKLKHFVDSIPPKQYGNTFKFANEQKTKVKIQGLERSIRVLGGHQIPRDCEITKAELIRKPSGIYLHETCYTDKDKYKSVWE